MQQCIGPAGGRLTGTQLKREALTIMANADISLICELNLLAINAQYTNPPVPAGKANSDEVYTFLSDDRFVISRPESLGYSLYEHAINYTAAPGAYPPSIRASKLLGRHLSHTRPTKLVWADESGLLAVRLAEPASTVIFHRLSDDGLSPTDGTLVLVQDLVGTRDEIIFVDLPDHQ
jgi:hypothetical protein